MLQKQCAGIMTSEDVINLYWQQFDSLLMKNDRRISDKMKQKTKHKDSKNLILNIVLYAY